jgi:hypothetical protein
MVAPHHHLDSPQPATRNSDTGTGPTRNYSYQDRKAQPWKSQSQCWISYITRRDDRIAYSLRFCHLQRGTAIQFSQSTEVYKAFLPLFIPLVGCSLSSFTGSASHIYSSQRHQRQTLTKSFLSSAFHGHVVSQSLSLTFSFTPLRPSDDTVCCIGTTEIHLYHSSKVPESLLNHEGWIALHSEKLLRCDSSR